MLYRCVCQHAGRACPRYAYTRSAPCTAECRAVSSMHASCDLDLMLTRACCGHAGMGLNAYFGGSACTCLCMGSHSLPTPAGGEGLCDTIRFFRRCFVAAPWDGGLNMCCTCVGMSQAGRLCLSMQPTTWWATTAPRPCPTRRRSRPSSLRAGSSSSCRWWACVSVRGASAVLHVWAVHTATV